MIGFWKWEDGMLQMTSSSLGQGSEWTMAPLKVIEDPGEDQSTGMGVGRRSVFDSVGI